MGKVYPNDDEFQMKHLMLKEGSIKDDVDNIANTKSQLV